MVCLSTDGKSINDSRAQSFFYKKLSQILAEYYNYLYVR